MLIPLSFPVVLLRIGTRSFSYIVTEAIIPMAASAKIEAGGTSKPFATSLFMVAPCLMKYVEDCATHTPNGRVASQIGIKLRTNFIFSTLVTVASLQGLGFSAKFCALMITALSRNLKHMMPRNFCSYNMFVSD
ncbi:hypothetical protein ACFX15_009400 [Malus domestica]